MTVELTRYLSDAAHFPGGHADGVAIPTSPTAVASIVRHGRTILPIGAQSSLTGGATPMGELILSTEKLTNILEVDAHRIRVEAGVTVAQMQEAVAAVGAWFPPAPTFTGACAGGIVATNAAGAATFKYGSARRWVEALTVTLASGHELTLARGNSRADDHILRIDTGRDTITVPVPRYRMPDVPKRSAGYFAAAGMDPIDLFIGSEGTLGVITSVTFRVLGPAPTSALALIPCASEEQAFAVVDGLRRQSVETWRTHDKDGIDACAVEHLDRRCIDIVREDGADRKFGVDLPANTGVVLLVQLELSPQVSDADAFDQLAAGDSGADGPLVRFSRLLAQHAALDDTEIALPANRRRMDQFIALREAVPDGVNRRVGMAQRDVDPRIAKTAADMIVPFGQVPEMMRIYRAGFARRGLDFAVWGHISDGNVHPNVLPRSYEDVERGREAILEFGREVTRLGGCPLAEHGVGRNGVKQALLRQLYGDEGIDQMRAVKRALDPEWKLAPGVIFPAGS